MPQTVSLTQFINVSLGVFATLVVIPILIYAWPRRHVYGVGWFIGLAVSVGFMTFCYTLEALAGFDLATFITFSKIEYLALTSIPVIWLGFALSQSKFRYRLAPSTLRLLMVIPVITTLLALTNEWHGLIWAVPRLIPVSGSPVFAPDYGLWFWVFITSSYGLMFIGSLILLGRVRSQWRLYRMQAILILSGALLPWISNVLVVFDDINPYPQISLNSLFLGLAVLAFAFAQFRLGLLNFLPIAYQTIFNQVPDGIIVLDNDNHILAVNQEVVRFLGTQEQSMVGKAITDVFPTYASYLEQFDEQAEFSDVMEIDQRHIALRVTPMLSENRQQIGRLFVLNDVTAEHQMEESQRKQDVFAATMLDIAATLSSTLETGRVLALLLENVQRIVAHDASNIMVYDEQTRTARIRYTHGYSPESDAALRQRDFPLADFPTLLTVATTRQPFVITEVGTRTDWKLIAETSHVVSYGCAPIYVDDQLVGFLNLDSFTSDKMPADIVTPLRLIAQQAAAAFRNASLYEQTRTQAVELQRRVTSLTIMQQMNRDISAAGSTEKLLDIALDAILRLSSATGGVVALADGDHQLLRAHYYGHYDLAKLDGLLSTPQGIIQQVLTQRQSVLLKAEALPSAMLGSRAQIALPLITEADSGDQTSLFGVILLETTQADRFSQDRFELLTIIADRLSVSLQNLQLLEAQRSRAAEMEKLYRQVSDLEELKSEMIRVAAHDLKNPLNIVISYISMLRDMPEFKPADPKTIYDIIYKASYRMDDIIRDFLSLERIGRLANNLTLQNVDLVELVRKSEHEFVPMAFSKNQTLIYELPADPHIAWGDAVLAYEALANFLSNAIKYTPQGGRIVVTIARQEQVLLVSVQDNGYGIPYDAQNRLFSPFYRVVTTETSSIEGTGLGLHLTKSIIERQHGRVRFESQPGQGSTFGFELPLSTTF